MSKLFIEQRYGQIPNHILNDKNISFKAKGLWGYLQSKPDGWDFSVHRIPEESADGRDGVSSGLQELEHNGYLSRIKTNNGNGTFEMNYVLKQGTPPCTENPYTVKPNTVNPYINKEVDSNKYNNKLKSKNKKAVEIKPITVILEAWSEYGVYNIEDLASASIQRKFTADSIGQMAEKFLKHYEDHPEKIDKTFNVRSRFSTFVAKDFTNIMRLKPKWSGIENVNDDEVDKLLQNGYFKNPNCKFYQDVVKPTLDVEGIKKFNAMIGFFNNRTIGNRKDKTFEEWYLLYNKTDNV